ncbi:hypothetical protein VNI00_012335 [Paramarasmius palmivorus]|uniref:Hydrophobin n=1 Tax=Paramarasmius palmivorus TaxID=297713 RepID=A0AAW0C4G0_9AGAR
MGLLSFALGKGNPLNYKCQVDFQNLAPTFQMFVKSALHIFLVAVTGVFAVATPRADPPNLGETCGTIAGVVPCAKGLTCCYIGPDRGINDPPDVYAHARAINLQIRVPGNGTPMEYHRLDVKDHCPVYMKSLD